MINVKPDLLFACTHHPTRTRFEPWQGYGKFRVSGRSPDSHAAWRREHPRRHGTPTWKLHLQEIRLPVVSRCACLASGVTHGGYSEEVVEGEDYVELVREEV